MEKGFDRQKTMNQSGMKKKIHTLRDCLGGCRPDDGCPCYCHTLEAQFQMNPSEKQIYVFIVEDEEAAKRMRQDEWSYACELPSETRRTVVDFLNELA